ncbi:MAG TPA: glutamine synthetase family protein [Thermomicrobiales bacterium]|nr:glutamine synthetase family protein [Thermomicrobiales bacterium]
MAAVDEGALNSLQQRTEADDLDGLWITFHDYSARACAKWIPRASIPAALRRGGVFARANLNFTIDDHQVPQPHFAADSGDMFAVPDPDTYAPIPYRPGFGRVLSYLCTEEGDLWEGCPRGRLQAALDALAERGFSAQAAFEPEFTFYERRADDGYQPVDHFAMYSVDRIDANASLLGRIDKALTAQGVRVIQLGTEYGAGQLEINLHHETPMKAADDLVTFRETVKALARDAGIVASFMPKPFADAAGNGVHVHLSLWDAEGQTSRSEGEGPLGLSPDLAHFMAGVLAHAPALCGVAAPTVNSYKRLLPGSWAPGHIAWGSGNRAVLVRVPGSSRRRIEFRAGDHTGNPHLFLAALLAAGIDGLDRQLDPGAPVEGDIGHMSIADVERMGGRFLPRTAHDALNAIEADETVMAALGPVCGPELLRIKRYELERYDTQVSDWEREVYLERA